MVKVKNYAIEMTKGGSVTSASPGQFYGASGFGYELVYIY